MCSRIAVSAILGTFHTMIRFIKILSYRLSPESGDVFDYLCDVTSQKNDPPSLEPGRLVLTEPIIFHSTLKRARECLAKNSSARFYPRKDLAEIPFDLVKVCPRELWDEEGSVAVRRGFKRAFINDQLGVSRQQIFEEIRDLLTLCRNQIPGKNMAVVSHSFRLALIEAFVATRGLIESNPSLIADFINDSQKRYEFGGGFVLDEIARI